MDEHIARQSRTMHERTYWTLPIHKKKEKFKSPFNSFPLEIILQILAYLPLETTADSVLMMKLFPKFDPYTLLTTRADPRVVFSELVSNPGELLEVMLLTDTYFRGSRAINYFLPGFSDEDSDWDFYVSDSFYQRYLFFHYMLSIGLVLDNSDSETNYRDPLTSIDFTVLTGSLKYKKSYKVQLVGEPGIHPIRGMILKTDFSLCQCYIAGHGCASINSYLTKFSQSTFKGYYNEKTRKEKYRKRNVKIITSKEANRLSSIPREKSLRKIRHIGDNDSFELSFFGRDYIDAKYNVCVERQHHKDQLISWFEYNSYNKDVNMSINRHVLFDPIIMYSDKLSDLLLNSLIDDGLITFKPIPAEEMRRVEQPYTVKQYMDTSSGDTIGVLMHYRETYIKLGNISLHKWLGVPKTRNSTDEQVIRLELYRLVGDRLARCYDRFVSKF